jgi:hypothetical protein
MKRWGLVVAVGGAAAACGSDAAGEMLRDAGEVLADAGAWLADAGGRADGGAQAQPGAVEGRCDKVYEQTTIARSQGAVFATTTMTRWYAEFAMDTSGVVGVDALKCGHEAYGAHVAIACPEGATCSGQYFPPLLDCQASSTADVKPGLLRVDCGYRQRVDYASAANADVDNGDLYKTVRVVVRR